MGKTRGVHETTPELRNRMVGMYEAGLGLRDIAAAVNCSQRTVKRWLNRFDKEGTVETRERCGRKRATTTEQDDAIIRLATQTPITAAKAVLPALGLSCSVDTIRERLHKAGIHNWSPSRKHMQRIPLSDGEGTTIQQAVWRPTGTQLGRKKVGSKNATAKSRKPGGSTAKRKQKSLKLRARDVYVGDGAPAEVLKQSEIPDEMVFQPQNVTQDQRSGVLSRVNDDVQNHGEPLANAETEFSGALCPVQPPQPQMYQHHPGLNVVQNWPLDLVQGSHHYPQGQPHPMSHDQPPPQHQLQELHTQREQEHRAQQQAQQRQDHQPHMGEHVHQHQLQSHGNLEHNQPEDNRIEHRVHQQPERKIPSNPKRSAASRRSGKIVRSDGRSNSVSSNEQISDDGDDDDEDDDDDNDDDDDEDFGKDGSKEDREETSNGDGRKKKKGGKAKGTLETSVEIRNRMIGMSEAGLSTLSIALAINRSERTVKRWLERWNKEGNVRTKERKGRRRITTKEQDDAIIAMATQNPLTAAKHVAPALGLNCSVDTIRERLHKAGIHSWKLGKKQGEGNAVHTVHLWQPSGNRPNKPKLPSEKRKKSSIVKKRVSNSSDAPKRVFGKKKSIIALAESKIVSPTVDMIPESVAMEFHDNANLGNFVGGPEMMEQVHGLEAQGTSIVPSSSAGSQPPGPPAMQAMEPMMQQRSDCRMAPPIGSAVPGQTDSAVSYPSCMVSGNGHVNHMEQPDPLNYEPYIWSF